MAGIAKMGSCSYRRNHPSYPSHSYQAVARPHLTEELEAMNVNDLVVMD